MTKELVKLFIKREHLETEPQKKWETQFQWYMGVVAVSVQKKPGETLSSLQVYRKGSLRRNWKFRFCSSRKLFRMHTIKVEIQKERMRENLRRELQRRKEEEKWVQ